MMMLVMVKLIISFWNYGLETNMKENSCQYTIQLTLKDMKSPPFTTVDQFVEERTQFVIETIRT